MSLSFRTNGNFIDFVNTDATSLQVETVLMSLHNTSRCIDWSLPEDTTKISFTIDEVKYSNIPVSEIDFDGTVMNSQDDFQTGAEAMFPGLAGGSPGGGVESVTGDAVDNTDPLNPVINSTGGSYLVAEVELTNAEIINLPTLGKQIIPAVGVGKVLNVIAAFFVSDFSGATYTGDANSSWILKGDNSGSYYSCPVILSNVLSNGGYFGKFPTPLAEIGAGVFAAYAVSFGLSPIGGAENDNLIIKDELGGVSNYTGGDAANTLKVTVFYTINDK